MILLAVFSGVIAMVSKDTQSSQMNGIDEIYESIQGLNLEQRQKLLSRLSWLYLFSGSGSGVNSFKAQFNFSMLTPKTLPDTMELVSDIYAQLETVVTDNNTNGGE